MRGFGILMLFFAWVIVSVSSWAKEAVVRMDLNNSTVKLRIAFNYANIQLKRTRIKGVDGYYGIDFPLPNKWEVVHAEGYVKYNPSILLIEKLSGGVIFFNDKPLQQFHIYDYKREGVRFEIPPQFFKPHNRLMIEFIMHYTLKCEDASHSTLWSDIDMEQSYLELTVRPKPMHEWISSIAEDVFDDKQYAIEKLNFIYDPADTIQKVRAMALMSAVAAGHLKYRLADIDLSSAIDPDAHNLFIGTKAQAATFLKKSFASSLLFGIKPKKLYDFNDPSCFVGQGKRQGVLLQEEGALWGKSLMLTKDRLRLESGLASDSKEVDLSFWVKTKYKKRQALAAFGSYGLISYQGHMGFTTGQRDFYGAKIDISDGKWHHIVAHFSDSLQKSILYVDAKEIPLKRFDRYGYRTIATDFSKLWVGGVAQDRQFNATAQFDQIYLFDHPLKLAQVQAIYHTSLARSQKRASEHIFVANRLAHDLSIFQNPDDPSKAVIVVAPSDPSKTVAIIEALTKEDLSHYRRPTFDLKEIKIPKPAKAYSAKGFIKDNRKIYFKELGYETTLLKGWYPEKIRLGFKVYPDFYFDSKESIKSTIHYVFPSVIHDDSVVNIYLNNKFARQVPIAEGPRISTVRLTASLLFNVDSFTKMPVYLLKGGKNEMMLDFSLVPMKKGYCEIYNEENLVATVMDDSYFVLPKAKRLVEMPYMEYLRDAQYPFSIYPDLQDTVILLANRSPQTVASAMNFVFFLAEEIGSFPYYLTIVDHLGEAEKKKHLIVFGRSTDAQVIALSKEAPVHFDEGGMRRVYPLIKRFVEHKDLLSEDRRKKYRYQTVMDERNFVDDNLIMQMFRSPFDQEKTVVMLAAQTPQCLNEGVKSLRRFENRHLIKGDLLVYNAKSQEGVTFNVKKKYLISHMNFFESLAVRLAYHPLVYFSVALIALLVAAWLLYYLLEVHKKRRHGDVE